MGVHVHKCASEEEGCSHVDDQLQRLQTRAEMSEPRVEDAFAEVRVGSDGVAMRVEGAEQAPEDEAGVACSETHCRARSVDPVNRRGSWHSTENVKDCSRDITNLTKRIRCIEWTQNVRRDEVEYRNPAGSS